MAVIPQVYQLKVTLNDIEPPIWRRFLVRSDAKLTRLHNILLVLMDWSNYHLYGFQVGGLEYTDPEELEEDIYDRNLQDGSKMKLSKALPEVGDSIPYCYDFGDNWVHTIVLEKILDPIPGKKYPVCLEGARNTPPEDCGGTMGYEHLLEVLADPENAEYEELKEWVGPHFDPERFEIEWINRELRGRVLVKES